MNSSKEYKCTKDFSHSILISCLILITSFSYKVILFCVSLVLLSILFSTKTICKNGELIIRRRFLVKRISLTDINKIRIWPTGSDGIIGSCYQIEFFFNNKSVKTRFSNKNDVLQFVEYIKKKHDITIINDSSIIKNLLNNTNINH